MTDAAGLCAQILLELQAMQVDIGFEVRAIGANPEGSFLWDLRARLKTLEAAVDELGSLPS